MRSTENLPGGDPRSSNCEQACLTGTSTGQISVCAATGKETTGNLAKSGLASTPAAFDAVIKRDYAMWARVIKDAGIKLE